jgi:hypothetical protein
MGDRVSRRRWLVVAVVLAFALALVGVIVVSARTGHESGKLQLISVVPAGYVLDPVSSGSLSRDAAADSTVIAAETLRPRLEDFRTGHAKMWRSAQGRFIEVAAYRFGSASQARSFMHLQLDYARQLAVAGARVVGPVKGVPGAMTFYVQGEQDSDGTPLFIWGSWFTRGDVAYLVELGGPQPASTSLLVALTQSQFRLVD